MDITPFIEGLCGTMFHKKNVTEIIKSEANGLCGTWKYCIINIPLTIELEVAPFVSTT
jgi:hypothetical protein